MSERNKLIQTLKHLIHANKVKQLKFQEQHYFGEEVGCITKEACVMASLLPKMHELNVKFDDMEFQ